MDIEYAEFGAIVVDGRRFDHDVVLDRGVITARDKGPSKPHRARFGHTPLCAGEHIPWTGSQLIVGTGASGRLPVMADVFDDAASRGIEVIAVPTGDACRLLRSMDASEVSAVLHVTC